MRLLGGKKQKTEINKRIPLVLDKKNRKEGVMLLAQVAVKGPLKIVMKTMRILNKKKTKIHLFRTLEINQ